LEYASFSPIHGAFVSDIHRQFVLEGLSPFGPLLQAACLLLAVRRQSTSRKHHQNEGSCEPLSSALTHFLSFHFKQVASLTERFSALRVPML
jgi:hypothetical protein